MAVGDIIKVDASTTTATLAHELIEYSRVVRKATELGDQIKGTMDHMTTAQIEEMYGLSAGNGAVVQSLVTGTRGSIKSATTSEFIDRVRPGVN